MTWKKKPAPWQYLGILNQSSLETTKKVKRLFDKITTADRTLIENSVRKFQIQVFNQTLDIIINQLPTSARMKLSNFFLF